MKQQFLYKYIYERLYKKQQKVVKNIINAYGALSKCHVSANILANCATNYLGKKKGGKGKRLLRKRDLALMDAAEVAYAHHCFRKMVQFELELIMLAERSQGGLDDR